MKHEMLVVIGRCFGQPIPKTKGKALAKASGMVSKMAAEKKVKFWQAILPILFLACAMIPCVLIFDAQPQILLLCATAISAVVAICTKYSWDDVVDGMSQGVANAAEAIVIVLIVGILIGIWSASGTVGTLIAYGLKLISPKYFLATAMLISSALALVAGSWGSIGTLGLALVGIGTAFGVPLPMIAGAVVSGAYVADQISPMTDIVALLSATSGAKHMDGIKRMLPIAACAYLCAFILFLVLGITGVGAGHASEETILALEEGLHAQFNISLWCLIPVACLALALLFKLPALGALLVGIISAIFVGIFTQGLDTRTIFAAAYGGFVSNSGNETLDALLSVGGLACMPDTISILLCAMVFNGVMGNCGQLAAITEPVVRRVKTINGLGAAMILNSYLVNIVLPDQYISITLVGNMYGEKFKDRKGTKEELFACLAAGGAATSALFAWNSCGMFISSVLGVSALEYAKYTFYNLLSPVAGIVFALFFLHKRGKSKKNAVAAAAGDVLDAGE